MTDRELLKLSDTLATKGIPPEQCLDYARGILAVGNKLIKLRQGNISRGSRKWKQRLEELPGVLLLISRMTTGTHVRFRKAWLAQLPILGLVAYRLKIVQQKPCTYPGDRLKSFCHICNVLQKQEEYYD